MIVTREYTEATVSANVESYAGGIALNAETLDSEQSKALETKIPDSQT